MPECGPPSSWRRLPECECWGKAVRRSVISSDATDIPVIQRYRPDILILLLGDNDIGCDKSAEEIANRLIALASQLYMGGHVSRIALCQMMPRSRAPRAAQRRMGGATGTRNADRYLLSYGQQAREANRLLKEAASSSRFLTFWDHNKKFRFIEDGQSQEGKFAADGIHLAPRAQYQLYKSLRGALLCASRSLAVQGKQPRN